MATATPKLTLNEMKKQMNENDRVTGLVRVSLCDIIDNDLEGFLDILSEGLTGSPLLMDIDYNVDHAEDNDLIIHVTGDASTIIETEEE